MIRRLGLWLISTHPRQLALLFAVGFSFSAFLQLVMNADSWFTAVACLALGLVWSLPKPVDVRRRLAELRNSATDETGGES